MAAVPVTGAIAVVGTVPFVVAAPGTVLVPLKALAGEPDPNEVRLVVVPGVSVGKFML